MVVSSPRDSVTISRAFYDTTTLIDITTSLPRSPDEPAYLRPSPPFIRSHVQLFAWCIQHIQPQPPSPSDKKSGSGGRLRLTCLWQHDLKALWGFGTSTAALTQQLSTMTLSLLKTVMKRGGRVPKLTGYGNGVSIERVRYQIDREALTLDYAIIPDDEEHSIHHELGLQGMDEVHALREHRRLTRSIECVLPLLEGWDVQVTMKGSSEEVEEIPWSAHAMRSRSNPSAFSPPDQVLLRITHGALMDDDAVLKVKVVIEVSGGTSGLRLNGLATKIHELEERDPSSYSIPQRMLQDVASAVDLSIQTSSSLGTVSSNASSSNGLPLIRRHPERTPAAEKSILSKVRRNYIYFSSLLQEPEAKWKRTTEARGVSITQLDSIDPTLVVYRAEATFVGVGLWDLYGAVVSPGARVHWDKQHEDGVLLEDVNELTELWQFKTKPAWPAFGRDSVVLKTVYKSPTTIHVFSFTADDPHLFPHIPAAEPNVIRTQIDLQGWAIEALSPTTTLLTLLEQSDPKGWTNKTSIPTQMINTLAGIGEFAIRCGGPPVVTRLAGSKANEIRYDHERGLFKVEYEPSASRRSTSTTSPANGSTGGHDEGGFPAIECEIRCDIDTWGASLDIVVDPPPQTITCLRRHRLSAEGGGLWLTLTHDSIFVDDERLLALVRRAPGKEKGLVMVNGAKVQVDVEELPEHEIKTLTRQKRVKPPRIPLDQPPVMGVIRRRKAEWSGAEGEEASATEGQTNGTSTSSWGSAPKISSPLSRFFTFAVDQATTTTQQAVAAISPANAASGTSALDPAKPPMQYALEALAWTQEFNSKQPTQEGWTLVGDKGMVVQRKLIPEISPFIPVHQGFKVIEGVSAEELASVITEHDCRKTWDERFDSARVLESYGGQARTAFMVGKGGFPFRDRGFYLAGLVAREQLPGSTSSHSSSASSSRRSVAEHSPTARNAIFCVSASFSPDSASAKAFSLAKYNPYSLPIGRVYIDAWILETLDPYTKENYAIPSARCTRLVAVDYAGSIPAAFNSMINATLARGVLAVEAYMKSSVKAAVPVTRLPAPGLVVSEKLDEKPSVIGSSGAGVGEDGEGLASGSALVVPGVSGATCWKLRKRDESRVLLETKFDVEKKVYRSSVLVVLPARFGGGSRVRREASSMTITGPSIASADNTTPTTGEKAANTATQTTPRPSGLVLGSTNSHSRERDRQRQTSDASLPDTSSLHSASSDSTLMELGWGTYGAAHARAHSANANTGSLSHSHGQSHNRYATEMPGHGSASMPSPVMTPLPMPGSMVMTPAPGGLPGTAAFPSLDARSSRTIDGLPRSPSRTRPSSSSISVSPSNSSGLPSQRQHQQQHPTPPVSPTRIRQRAASSGSGTLSHSHPEGSPSLHTLYPPMIRGRTTSSGFTARRREDKERDFVVLEVVVDSRMFCVDKEKGKGKMKGYRVDVRARRREGVEVRLGGEGDGKGRGVVALGRLGVDTSNATTANAKPQDQDLDIPFVTTIYTLPSSPLHSSSLAECGPGESRPVRHLVRVEVPSARYFRVAGRGEEGEGWEDPLRVEVVDKARVDKEKEKEKRGKEGEEVEVEERPEWLVALEEAGVVVDLVVSPLSPPSTSTSTATTGSASSSNLPLSTPVKTKEPGKGKDKEKDKVVVHVNGAATRVLGEKESLSALGREELVDGLGGVGVLVR
ncbi:hypothetical protein GALMADRAFT_1357807 [Galerina marginata CBS 339.88]|uniref:START domain-containing protein n=1 Tax=Galerina marginata (strain CBS 339.88) TaxID=685588 RepID=A0A067TET2_GALM3|nr:hypothetical protein GALMADRAFT_1357807 [Galerina marginata CBS 339.88]